MRRLVAILAFLIASITAHAAGSYSFGVLSQRSPVLTAEYWNPILKYVSLKAGVKLRLMVTHTAPESNDAITRGEYDFTYSNHLFKPTNLPQRYQVILRPRAQSIRGQVVTLKNSPIRTLADLNGKVVGFPSKAAFVGYAVPMDHLIRQGIAVKAVFGGNQEGIMGQLKVGKVIAAGVNDQVMQDYAAREGIQYRVLWQSQPYYNLPIAVHPRVPKPVVQAVQQAFAGMYRDPEGVRILAASAKIIDQKPPLGFLPAEQNDYRNYIDFYKKTVLKDFE